MGMDSIGQHSELGTGPLCDFAIKTHFPRRQTEIVIINVQRHPSVELRWMHGVVAERLTARPVSLYKCPPIRIVIAQPKIILRGDLPNANAYFSSNMWLFRR
jgi:hypothetical protein